MLASARAAASAGGEVIGVTCSAFKRGEANEYVSKEILTNSLNDRLNKLIELGDGYIVLPGGTGTLLELAAVWELKNKGFLDGGKPIILMGDFWRPLVELMAVEDARSAGCIEVAATVAAAVEMLAQRI
jgi:predicted Rossmann-fold nucleotide-binding protein